MLNAEMLMQWQYLIFLLPLAVSALLLLLSSVRLGRHGGAHGGHGGHGHGVGHAHSIGHAHSAGQGVGHGHSGGHGHASAQGHGGTGRTAPTHPAGQARAVRAEAHSPGRGDAAPRFLASPAGMLLSLMGVGRAPLPMVLEAFCMAWGFCGFFANELFLSGVAHPSLIKMLPSFGLALVGGLAGARLASEIMARLMPPEESQIVSRDGLFGLTGMVTFPVSATSGRIHLYDEFGTLHDEMCRVTPGYPTIDKGHTVMVMDTDPQGLLIVEEIPPQAR